MEPLAFHDATSVDMTRLQDLASELGSFDIVVELSAMFVEHVGGRMQAFRVATETEHAEEIRSAAHAVRGACCNFGAVRMTELSRQIEEFAVGREFHAVRVAMSELEGEFTRVCDILEERILAPAAEGRPVRLAQDKPQTSL